MTEDEDGLSGARAEGLAGVLKGLAHPMRLRIVALLCRRRCTVSELVDELSARQAAVSQQLATLRMLKLVSVSRRGGFAVYALAEPKLRSLVKCLSGCKTH